MKRCSLCERGNIPDEFIKQHQLNPKTKDITPLCQSCYKQIHHLFTNEELKNDLFTIPLLQEDRRVKKWIKWVCKNKRTKNVNMVAKKRNK